MGEEVTYRVGIPVLGLRGENFGRLEKVLFSESRHHVTGLVVRSLDSLHIVSLEKVTSVSGTEIRTRLTAQELHQSPAFDPTQYEEVPPWFFPPGHHIELGALVTIKPLDVRELGESEALSRRTFMGKSVALLATAIGVSLLVPIGGYIMAAATTPVTDNWRDLGVKLQDLPLDEPVQKPFRAVSVSGWMRVPEERSVWLIRHSGVSDIWSESEDEKLNLDSPLEKSHSDPRLTVLSPVCPHLGCEPQWHKGQKLFICPCHHSIYQLNGKRIGGPAPRPMDQLPVRIAPDGSISVIYEQFAIGIAAKVRLA
ncbi:MAG: ubiquinol-cytochrome c reductase iron-sulfur subunit [Nitrospirae bacterium]|nr:ubiquinol-cytochrome c reductase iron-sulfur subunit [Nitrospirota bacterium]MCL5285590.1 ubiquinol-cytochrome c reductase iron-sulfur subunit [Nitrospirota bacterium]